MMINIKRLNDMLLEFLSNLTPQINGYLVNKDNSAREVATNRNNKLKCIWL